MTNNFSTGASGVELRLATTEDTQALWRLAALDSQAELEGRVLMALVDGNAVAAISLYDMRSIADPFVLTQDLVALLRLRAEHLAVDTPSGGWRRLRPRLRTAWA